MMKTHTPEEARVAENERTLRLAQNKVVMFFGLESWRLRPQLSGHAEMNADPVPAREFEKHLLSPRERTEKTASG